jgi:hypothetical protein
MKKLDQKEARSLFEEVLGKRISDASWYRLKPVFGDNFPLIKQNVTWLAEIKKQLPKCDLRLVPVVNSVKVANELIAGIKNKREGITGIVRPTPNYNSPQHPYKVV